MQPEDMDVDGFRHDLPLSTSYAEDASVADIDFDHHYFPVNIYCCCC